MKRYNAHNFILLTCLSACGQALPFDNTTRDTPPDALPQFTRCAVTHADASDHFNTTIKLLHRSTDPDTLPVLPERRATLVVNTYVHIISDILSVATVTKQDVLNQIQTMNTAYNPNGVSFNLVATDLTVNDAWSVGNGADLDAAKRALRKGTYADLNLYFHTNLTGGILGTCTLPSQLPPGSSPKVYFSDGCNMHAGSMPGGWIYGYNTGMTAVHETGHWLGLLHTFEGYSCSGEGDHIADTRQESTSTDGCPSSPAKNSCPNLAGVDPIHNYMDYSTDECYQSFSSLQTQRMRDMWQQYRVGR